MMQKQMRNIRGVKNLEVYLKSINCPIGENTLYKLVRENQIPHKKISKQVFIFNLDKVDDWLQQDVS
ncbi:helix-turn-helix domain-containing protein [Virgibacillus salexigens]|uniref:helix-turn-helix domain-containing protein n=1 Tax=Virgibacillus salexigens TaxID=61016 RepID=UPI001909BE54|nr:helix-turn-helix domain-containing protein [Virgibacillus salexigens]